MSQRNNSSLFFVCSLIERMGRALHLRRGELVAALGQKKVTHLLDYADVLHCEPIEKVSDDFIGEYGLSAGDFDNLSAARYAIPDVWTIGKVYARLIEDVSADDTIAQTLIAVYTSWIDEAISDYNSSFYYQSRDYIAECYRQGEVLDA